jgi:uncharacterized OB-fold protein
MATSNPVHSVLKPQPRVTELTRPFWDGANEGRLMIQRCTHADCGKSVFYPRVCCPFCKRLDLAWVQATGRGTVLSNTTVYRTHHDGFNQEAPYVFAAVALEEGALVYAQLPGAPPEQSLIGARVEVAFQAHGPDRQMPVFRLTAE